MSEKHRWIKPRRGKLMIYIDGVPPGIKVAVFDQRVSREDEARTIVLEEVTEPSYSIEAYIDREYGGAPVKVVIRRAGFLPYQYQDTIEEGIGLFHAARLEIDRVFKGTGSGVPAGWNPIVEWREAEKRVQTKYRKFKKDNRRARWMLNVIDYGLIIIGGIIGFLIDPVLGTIIGVILGIMGKLIGSRLASRAMGWD
jgi:hypothetical protein